jgi:hypothetical protein
MEKENERNVSRSPSYVNAPSICHFCLKHAGPDGELIIPGKIIADYVKAVETNLCPKEKSLIYHEQCEKLVSEFEILESGLDSSVRSIKRTESIILFEGAHCYSIVELLLKMSDKYLWEDIQSLRLKYGQEFNTSLVCVVTKDMRNGALAILDWFNEQLACIRAICDIPREAVSTEIFDYIYTFLKFKFIAAERVGTLPMFQLHEQIAGKSRQLDSESIVGDKIGNLSMERSCREMASKCPDIYSTASLVNTWCANLRAVRFAVAENINCLVKVRFVISALSNVISDETYDVARALACKQSSHSIAFYLKLLDLEADIPDKGLLMQHLQLSAARYKEILGKVTLQELTRSHSYIYHYINDFFSYGKQ